LNAEYPSSVIEEISDRDTQFRDRDRYFRLGRNALDCIRLCMTAARKADVKRILDLPCGYGRVLRWIKAEFPAAQLGACDIDPKGVDFCAATFGAEPVYGRENPADVEIEAPFDLVWSSSLLTHLPPHQWDAFLELFERALVPGELMIFTTHGRRIAELMHDPERRRVFQPIDHEALLHQFEREGSAYVEYQFDAARREQLSLPSAYGVSLTRPSSVCAMLERRPALRLVCYSEGRFNGQDLVAAVRVGT
jgi:SAM-dependent methyltransferase